ncbi:MAG: selenide, water dikinase SelD [Bacteroidetes bacterium 4572_77]|nr:MAG: selenide, water dikinase SelD [Bacteroidetes bacterium 4572_77]
MQNDLLLDIEGEGGCSAKLPAKDLEKALADLPKNVSDKMMVDADTHDDAGVIKINEDTALIQTTDFFPALCQDPYEFGQIAAANALSDVFAMGGQVLTAMNLLMFPAFKSMESLKEILRGGQEKVAEAGGFVVGGHTITDSSVKYGLAVSGIVHPDKVITNADAQEGDVLILSKPIGAGIILSGKKIGEAKDQDYQAALDNMKQLNKIAAELMQKYDVKSATDITGFGLLGHALRMAQASRTSFYIETTKIPYLKGAYELAEMGCLPGACFRNQEFVEELCHISSKVDYNHKMLTLDAQTSGGLLMAVKKEDKDKLIMELKKAGYSLTAEIGHVQKQKEKAIYLIP